MTRLELRKHNNRNHEISLFYSEKGKEKPFYTNILTKDPTVIALILRDLELNGYPIKKGIREYFEMEERRDWLGTKT